MKYNLTFQKLINDSSRSIIFAHKHLSTIQSNISLGHQMQLFNKQKQFQKSLSLFDKYKEKNIQQLSILSITQALKACAEIRDFQRGLNIHKFISSRINNDSYILSSLIHFYSKFTQ